MEKRIFGGRTSIDEGHNHLWFIDSKHTTIDGRGHNHRINLRIKMALANHPGGHSHCLLIENE